MERERQFIHDLYKNRIGYIPFLEYFRNDKFLKMRLFKQYLNTNLKPNPDFYYYRNCRPLRLKENHEKEVLHWREILHEHIIHQDLPDTFYTPTIEETPIFKGLEHAFKIIEDFKNRILLPKDYDPIKYAETFVFNFIDILKNLEIGKLTEKVLSDFLKDNKNATIRGEIIFGNKDLFRKKYKISYAMAWEYYRELKGYADLKIKKFLKEMKRDENFENNGQSKLNRDFSKWLIIKSFDWKGIGFDYTTGRKYQQPQDLKAVFWNAYVYYPEKVKSYFDNFGVLPIKYLDNLIFDFRQHFPKRDRMERINYFDDLIIQLINSYQIKEFDFKSGIINEQKPLQQSEITTKIQKHFNFFQGNCPRKHKQIIKEDEFNRLIQWTKYFFENGFEVPEISKPIKIVNTNKGYVRLAFRYLFKELHKEKTYPKSLFEFYRSAFTPFEFDKRKHFEAEKNNDEVKKLMEIDY